MKGEALQAAMLQQTWDPSVKALAAVPQTLAMMSDKIDWTQHLGDAFLAQPQDVLEAVQTLRRQHRPDVCRQVSHCRIRRLSQHRGSRAHGSFCVGPLVEAAASPPEVMRCWPKLSVLANYQ